MENIKTPYDGKKALIIGKEHPHVGEIVVCIGSNKTFLGRYGLVFKGDDGESFYVFEPTDIKWL